MAQELAVEELPALLGDLEAVRVTALARLYGPTLVQQQRDELLDVREAARRLGMSVEYVYKNSSTFPFVIRIGKRVRFSAAGIDEYIRSDTGRGSTAVRRNLGLPLGKSRTR